MGIPEPPMPAPSSRDRVRPAMIAVVLLGTGLLGAIAMSREARNPNVTAAPTDLAVASSPVAASSNPIPAALTGWWWAESAMGGSEYWLNFQSDALVSFHTGPEFKLGRATSYEPINGTSGVLTIDAPAPCGRGSYVVLRSAREAQFTVRADSCGPRAGVLLGRTWTMGVTVPARTRFEAGERYRTDGFSEPFEFIATALDPSWGSAGSEWATAPDLYAIVGFSRAWLLLFLDDRPVFSDACLNGGSTLPDIPTSAADVADWLAATPGLLASNATELEVDGRVALRFDIAADSACELGAPMIAPGYRLFNAEATLHVYAIPTGDDVILAILASDSGGRSEMRTNADLLIGSIVFE